MTHYLIFVDNSKIDSNKFYNITVKSDSLEVEYGRVGTTNTKLFYPLSKFRSLYNSKIK